MDYGEPKHSQVTKPTQLHLPNPINREMLIDVFQSKVISPKLRILTFTHACCIHPHISHTLHLISHFNHATHPKFTKFALSTLHIRGFTLTSPMLHPSTHISPDTSSRSTSYSLCEFFLEVYWGVPIIFYRKFYFFFRIRIGLIQYWEQSLPNILDLIHARSTRELYEKLQWRA